MFHQKNRIDKLNQPMSIGGEARLGATSSKWVSVATGILIAVAGFVFHLNLEMRLERLEVFDQHNVMFDADPNDVLFSFTHGGGPDENYRRGLVHPLENFFLVPIRAFVKALSIISPDELDKVNLRR